MTTEVQDERRNLPSASGIERIFLCPGSWALEQQCPPLPPSEDAESGTKIHAALAKNDPAGLTDEQTETFMKCLALEAELLEKTFPGEEAHQTIIEERLWDNLDGEVDAFSGKADRIHLQDGHALVIDWKSSRGETASAERNPQLRALAALTWVNLSVDRVTVAIIQPWASPQVSVCFYNDDALVRARLEIIRAIGHALDPHPQRIPGERQCKYCRGLSVCPEAKREVHELWNLAVGVKISTVLDSPEKTAQFLNMCSYAQDVIDSFRTLAKSKLESDPNSIPGWRLKPGAIKSTIIDVRPIYERLKNYSVRPEEFAAIVKLNKKDLNALIKDKTGYKGQELESHMETILEGCTEEKQNAPSLERVTV